MQTYYSILKVLCGKQDLKKILQNTFVMKHKFTYYLTCSKNHHHVLLGMYCTLSVVRYGIAILITNILVVGFLSGCVDHS